MSPERAAIISISLFGVWILFNLSLMALGLMQEPWHTTGPYTIGGSVFAVLSGGLGFYSRIRGKSHLDRRLYGWVLIPALGSASFFVCLAMAATGMYD